MTECSRAGLLHFKTLLLKELKETEHFKNISQKWQFKTLRAMLGVSFLLQREEQKRIERKNNNHVCETCHFLCLPETLI